MTISENFSENRGRPQKYDLRGFASAVRSRATTRRGLIEEYFAYEMGRVLGEAKKSGEQWPDYFIDGYGAPKQKRITVLSALGRYYEETGDVLDALAWAEVVAERQLKAKDAVRIINQQRKIQVGTR